MLIKQSVRAMIKTDLCRFLCLWLVLLVLMSSNCSFNYLHHHQTGNRCRTQTEMTETADCDFLTFVLGVKYIFMRFPQKSRFGAVAYVGDKLILARLTKLTFACRNCFHSEISHFTNNYKETALIKHDIILKTEIDFSCKTYSNIILFFTTLKNIINK